MVDPKFEEFYKNFSSVDPSHKLDFSTKIKTQCHNLKKQQAELENYLGESSPNSLFANINLNDLIMISKQLEKDEDFDDYDNTDFKLPLKQKLLKVFHRIDAQKILNLQSGLEIFRRKINNLKILFGNYKSLDSETPNEKIKSSMLSKIALIQTKIKDFDNEDLQTKLFKHLNKKLDLYYDLQLKNFQAKMMNLLYDLKDDSLAFETDKIEDFFEKIPAEFHEFKHFFLMKITGLLYEKLKVSISPEFFEITALKCQESEKINNFLPFSSLKFEKLRYFFPKEENDLGEYQAFIEDFFRIVFENIAILNKFPEKETQKQKDYFIEQILEFLKTLNLKIFEKQNRVRLSQKIKDLETIYQSYEYFNRDFHNYFENIQNSEIYEGNKTNLLEFKNSLCEIFKKIKNEPLQKENYLEIFEKTKSQIESLEKQYYLFEIETNKVKDSENNKNYKIFFLFLSYFLLILELMKIFEEDMHEISSLFYHSWISLLNLIQIGINKLSGVLISELGIKDRKVLNAIFNLNKTTAMLEIRYRTKLQIEEIALH